jgi:hypothetical protein
MDASGQERQDTLTRFQGVGTPDKTLSDLIWFEGERQYAQFSQRLRERVQEAAPARIAPQLSAPRLHIGYHLPAGVYHEAERPWHQVQTALAPLAAWLNSTDQQTPPARAEAGRVLFDVLFGTETAWEPIFRSLFHRPAPAPRPNPIRAGYGCVCALITLCSWVCHGSG